jgi:hypothetical protein
MYTHIIMYVMNVYPYIVSIYYNIVTILTFLADCVKNNAYAEWTMAYYDILNLIIEIIPVCICQFL